MADVVPVIKKNITNWLEYRDAFIALQQADNFIEGSINNTDWKSLREDYFAEGKSVKEAFQEFFYEQ
ncbi:hypothetical protein [Spirosoma pollinicola]|uniref:Uncharacterized protein n=1 Tax=Spirosoma pollinicola TaxID=2057025 RepID=A0A2K8YTL8_9BACT|nr:hypothetical protein [Spirosoma pollinicola]AUD00967.1 hypothetical protein CWM47_03520 [Spirosoma pollinicola]